MSKSGNRCRILNERGKLIVISSSSGGGKSTVIKEILKKRPELIFSVSATTRPPRAGEKDGSDYKFISREEFLKGIEEGRFLEWEEVHGELYGTERKILEDYVRDGRNVILDLDVHGGATLRSNYPETLLIFLYPPSPEVLYERLKRRGLNEDWEIDIRLSRYALEKAKGDKYPYRIINDDLETCIQDVLDVIDGKKEIEV